MTFYSCRPPVSGQLFSSVFHSWLAPAFSNRPPSLGSDVRHFLSRSLASTGTGSPCAAFLLFVLLPVQDSFLHLRPDTPSAHINLGQTGGEPPLIGGRGQVFSIFLACPEFLNPLGKFFDETPAFPSGFIATAPFFFRIHPLLRFSALNGRRPRAGVILVLSFVFPFGLLTILKTATCYSSNLLQPLPVEGLPRKEWTFLSFPGFPNKHRRIFRPRLYVLTDPKNSS